MSYRGNFGRDGNRGKGRSYHRGGGRGGSTGSDRNFTSKANGLCSYHVSGRCTKGDQCRYCHTIQSIGETRGHSSVIRDITMWNSRQQLFTCSADSTIKLWNCADWSEITTISVAPVDNSNSKSGENEGVVSMILEGNWLFVGFEGPTPTIPNYLVGHIRAWNLENPQATPFEFIASEDMPFSHSRTVLSLAVAVNGAGVATVFSGSTIGTIRSWLLDPATNMFKCVSQLEGHVRGVTRLKALIRDNSIMLISSSMDATIKIWDVAMNKCVKTLTSIDNGHTDVVMDLDIWENQNEHFLISGGLDKKVIVWSLTPPFGQVFSEIQDAQVTALATTQDVNHIPVLVVGLVDGSILVKELPTFQHKTVLSDSENFGHRDAVRRIIIGPDKRMLAWQWTGAVAAHRTK